jgi:hypothetical protein
LTVLSAVLGYASERQLCTALSMQTGWPAIVFDESSLRLDVLEHVSIVWARIFSALVVHEDERTLVVAAARPEDAIVPARELGSSRGKAVELRIALDVTLARTIRVAFRKWKQGEQYLVGSEAGGRKSAHIAIVQPDGGEDEQRLTGGRSAREHSVRHRVFGRCGHQDRWSAAVSRDRAQPAPDQDARRHHDIGRRLGPGTR